MNPTSTGIKNRIDERLDITLCGDPFQIHLHEQRYLAALAAVGAEDELLEIGTGLGVFSERVAPAVATYRGIEYDEEACQSAKKRVANPEWIQHGDAQALPFENNSCDVVVCLEVLEHLLDYRKALDEIHRVLRPDGRLIASIPYAKIGAPSKINPYHLYEPGEEEFRSELASRFCEASIRYHRYKESPLETCARILHLRKFVGLAHQYAEVSRGAPEEMEKIVIDSKRSGMLLGIFVVASRPKMN